MKHAPAMWLRLLTATLAAASASSCARRAPAPAPLASQAPLPEPATIAPDSEPLSTIPQPIDLQAENAQALIDPATPDDQRRLAALWLLEQGTDEVLRDLLAPGEPRDRLVATSLRDPRHMRRLLSVVPDPALTDTEAQAVLSAASSSIPSRDACHALLELAQLAPAQAQASLRALARMTGKRDQDAAAWQAWLNETAALDDAEFSRQIFAQLTSRIDLLEQRVNTSDRLLVDAFRRLHIAGDAAARVQLLAEMISSDRRGLQILGFELAERELADNVTLGQAVEDAALAALAQPDADVRASAARLLTRLAPPRAAGPLQAALMVEASPIAADALLLAMARWPASAPVEVVLKWMQEPRTVASASAVAVALVEVGLLASEEQRAAMRQYLMPLNAEPSASRLALLALIGNETEHQAIAALIGNSTDRASLAAIDALAKTPASTRILIAAVQDKPQFIPPTLVAIARQQNLALVTDHFPDLESWVQAHDIAASPRVRAALAEQIIARYTTTLSEEQLTLYRDNLNPE